jgi:hypothetical protein
MKKSEGRRQKLEVRTSGKGSGVGGRDNGEVRSRKLEGRTNWGIQSADCRSQIAE